MRAIENSLRSMFHLIHRILAFLILVFAGCSEMEDPLYSRHRVVNIKTGISGDEVTDMRSFLSLLFSANVPEEVTPHMLEVHQRSVKLYDWYGSLIESVPCQKLSSHQGYQRFMLADSVSAELSLLPENAFFRTKSMSYTLLPFSER